MGTTWRVHMAVPHRADLRAHHLRIEGVLDTVVAAMSTWAVDADITRFNRADAGTTHTMPEGFRQVLTCALEIAAASQGAFDPTLGELVGIWGFGANACRPQDIGQPQAVKAAQTRYGWQQVQLTGNQLFQPGGLRLDLSAIAKGYAADAISDALCAQGIGDALVEVGGELRARGCKPDGSAWRIAIEDATPSDEVTTRVIALNAQGVATSGDRWHYNDIQDRRVTHTIDPRSASPVTCQPMSVTVLASSAMRADAWATALRVLGPVEGMAMAEQHALAARFHWLDAGVAHEVMTAAFQPHLVQ